LYTSSKVIVLNLVAVGSFPDQRIYAVNTGSFEHRIASISIPRECRMQLSS
jgi:hypothetical protein